MVQKIRNIHLPEFIEDFFNNKDLSNIFEFNRPSMPAVNVIEGKEEFRIEVAAPSLKKEDFKVDLDNDVLTISSEKEEEESDKSDEKFMRKEFKYCAFKRSFTLPDTADEEKISATYKDGVLYISIPKKEDAKEKAPKTITIS